MANKKRLIDVSKIINHIQRHIDENVEQKNPVSCFVLGLIIKCLEQEPTVDAVEVVRCKACCSCTKSRWCNLLMMDVEDDSFCSYGKRRSTENA